MRKALVFNIVFTVIIIGCIIMSLYNLSERKALLKEFHNSEMEKDQEIDIIKHKTSVMLVIKSLFKKVCQS